MTEAVDLFRHQGLLLAVLVFVPVPLLTFGGLAVPFPELAAKHEVDPATMWLQVKIDRSFIGGMATTPQDRMIVRATIDLVHSLGLSVVAEGVETREVQALLRGFDCDVAQGFLYARPLPTPEVEASLASWGRVAA